MNGKLKIPEEKFNNLKTQGFSYTMRFISFKRPEIEQTKNIH